MPSIHLRGHARVFEDAGGVTRRLAGAGKEADAMNRNLLDVRRELRET